MASGGAVGKEVPPVAPTWLRGRGRIELGTTKVTRLALCSARGERMDNHPLTDATLRVP
jgi:hypothetical protein